MLTGGTEGELPLAVTRALDRLAQPLVVDRIVYATITLMSVLII